MKAFHYLICLLLFLTLCPKTEAQVYVRTAGIRMDESSIGLSLVQRLAKPITVEGILDFRKKDIGLALVPRIHGKILGRRLNYFIGAGPHCGLIKTDSQTLQAFWGIGGMFGIEYKFNLLPIHISYDFRPMIYLDGHPDLLGFQSAFAIRLVRKSERKEWKEKFKKWKDNLFDGDQD